MANIDTLKTRILAKVPLDALIGEYVRFEKRAGRNTACCPFHAEKTPSFYLYDDHYHCFGCGAHGDAISFAQHQQGLGFIEALKWLGNKYSIETSELERSNKNFKEWKNSAKKSQILLHAQEYFVKNFLSKLGEESRNYLKRRGFSEELLAETGFGYAPDRSQDLVHHLAKSGYSIKDLEEVSLASVFQGRAYDFFRHRITVPIRDVQGRIIAFGGRALGQQPQKYKNSRYDKGLILFGLDQARKAMRATGRGIVVEGYFDALKMHQFGFNECVACQGTALTVEHLRSLKSAASEIYLLFDGDQAGRQASLKLVEQSLGFPELRFKVALLPENEDPDSFLTSSGPKELEKLLRESRNLIDFAIQDKIKHSHGAALPSLINRQFVPWLSQIKDRVERSFLAEKIANLTGIDPEVIKAAIAGKSKNSNNNKIIPKKQEQISALVDEGHKLEPLKNLYFELIGHLYYSSPEDQLDLDHLQRFIKNDLILDEVWLYFTDELLDCLRAGKKPADQDLGSWTCTASLGVLALVQKFQNLKLAFKVENRKKILQRLMLYERQNKIKNTITSIKDDMSLSRAHGQAEEGEWQRLGERLIEFYQELRGVENSLRQLK